MLYCFAVRSTYDTKIMFIAVDGCVGVGKSTVAKGLAAFRKSEVLFESFESNPFLEAFYENPPAYATETEFTFLCLHFHQLRTHADTAKRGELVTDFHLGKDLLYAELNLKDARLLRVFKQLYKLMEEQVPKPTLLVCLSASTKLLTTRIRDRKREFELRVDPAYYAQLNEEYEKSFHRYKGRKLNICMDEWDFLRSPNLYQKLSQQIDERVKSQ